jgi:hypothetical protein
MKLTLPHQGKNFLCRVHIGLLDALLKYLEIAAVRFVGQKFDHLLSILRLICGVSRVGRV